MISTRTAAQLLGVPIREIDRVDDSPAGAVIVTTDGVSYLDVPADRPDAEGKVGLMLLAAPSGKPVTVIDGRSTWNGFPLYVAEELDDVDGGTADAGPGLDDLTLEALAALAEPLGIKAKGRSKADQHRSLVEQLTAAGVTAAPADPADDSTSTPGNDTASTPGNDAPSPAELLAAELAEQTDDELAERAGVVGVDTDGLDRDALIAAIVAAVLAAGDGGVSS